MGGGYLLSNARILVVDDEAPIRRILQVQLTQAQYNVVTASGVKEAFGYLENDDFDLIISDVNMPGIDGFEFRKRLLTDKGVARVPFVFLTARKEVEDKAVGFDLDVSAYLTKPFQRNELLSQVASLLRVDQQRSDFTSDERLGAIQKMVVTINHEINNPLTAVLGQAELLLMMSDFSDTDRVRMMVTELRNAGLKIREIVRKLGEVRTISTKPYLKSSEFQMVDLKASTEDPDSQSSESEAS